MQAPHQSPKALRLSECLRQCREKQPKKMAYAIFLPIWGKLSDRFGVKIMLLRGTFFAGVMFPGMAYVSAPWLIFLRFMSDAVEARSGAECRHKHDAQRDDSVEYLFHIALRFRMMK